MLGCPAVLRQLDQRQPARVAAPAVVGFERGQQYRGHAVLAKGNRVSDRNRSRLVCSPTTARSSGETAHELDAMANLVYS